VEQLFNQGAEELDNRDYTQAILYFNEVERQHPYSEWARRATLMTAFSHYRARQYDDAVGVAQRYISLHPGTDGAAYAYYLVGISYFEQIMDVGRDQKMTELTQAALTDVVRRFPETEYAKDATLKLDMVRDQLAGKEMEIGRWYLRRSDHLAAINRFKTVVEVYDGTSHVPEALHRLVESYLSIGLKGEAQAVGDQQGATGGDGGDDQGEERNRQAAGGENVFQAPHVTEFPTVTARRQGRPSAAGPATGPRPGRSRTPRAASGCRARR
jgi:outer membrane protein assembly factor BamD